MWTQEQIDKLKEAWAWPMEVYLGDMGTEMSRTLVILRSEDGKHSGRIAIQPQDTDYEAFQALLDKFPLFKEGFKSEYKFDLQLTKKVDNE